MLSSDVEDPWITEEERAVLTASATGLSVTEVAERLDRPPEHVRRAIASAITKLGARSKLEAIVIALRRGLIVLLAA
jgi:two-component system nitrate/nitrite response regulator NarL